MLTVNRTFALARSYQSGRIIVSQLQARTTLWAEPKPVSNGENGTLSSATAPLFVSLFPERDRSCHLMIHENSDDGRMYKKPLDYRVGRPLSGVMTLQNFIEGGYDVVDAKMLLVVKSIGAKKRGAMHPDVSRSH